MSKRLLNKVKYLLVALMLLAVLTSGAFYATSAKADTAYTLDSITTFKMVSGASVRVNPDNTADVHGLRFTVTMSESDRNTLFENVGAGKTYAALETGIIIMPKSYLGLTISKGDGTSNPTIANLFGDNAIYDWATWNDETEEWEYTLSDKERIININNQAWRKYTYTENEETKIGYKYTGSIIDLKQSNISKEMYSLAYMRAARVTDSGTEYDYLLSDGTSAAATVVAKKAIADWKLQITELETLINEATDEATKAELTLQKEELEAQLQSMITKYFGGEDPTVDPFENLTDVAEELNAANLVDLHNYSAVEQASFSILNAVSEGNKQTVEKMITLADTVTMKLNSYKWAGMSEIAFTYANLNPNSFDVSALEKVYYTVSITCVKGEKTVTYTGFIDLYDSADGVVVLPVAEEYTPYVFGIRNKETASATVENGMYKIAFEYAGADQNYTNAFIRPVHSALYFAQYYNGSTDSNGAYNAGKVFSFTYKFNLKDGYLADGTETAQSTSLETLFNFFKGHILNSSGSAWRTTTRRDVNVNVNMYFDTLYGANGENFTVLSTSTNAGAGGSALIKTVGNDAGVATFWLGGFEVTPAELASYSDYNIVLATDQIKDLGNKGLIDVTGMTNYDVKDLLSKTATEGLSDIAYIQSLEAQYGKATYVLIDRAGNETKLANGVLALNETALREYTLEVRIGKAVIVTAKCDLYDSEATPVWNYADSKLTGYTQWVKRTVGIWSNAMADGPVYTSADGKVTITNLDTAQPAYINILPAHSKEYYQLFSGKGYAFSYAYQASAKIYTQNYGYFGSPAGGTEAEMTGGKTVSLTLDSMLTTYYDNAFAASGVDAQKTGSWNAWGNYAMLGINTPNSKTATITLSIPKIMLSASSFTKIAEDVSADKLVNINGLDTVELQSYNVLRVISAENRSAIAALLNGVDSYKITLTSLYGELTPVTFTNHNIDLTSLEKAAYTISIKVTQGTTSDKEVYTGYIDIYNSEDGVVWLPVDEKFVSYIFPYESGTSWGNRPDATVTVENGLYKVSFAYGSNTASWQHTATVRPLHSKVYYERAYIGDTSFYSNGTTVKYNTSLNFGFNVMYTVADGVNKNGEAVTATTSANICFQQFAKYPIIDDGTTTKTTYHTQYAYNQVHTLSLPFDLIYDNFSTFTGWNNAEGKFLALPTALANGNTTFYIGGFNIGVGSTTLYSETAEADVKDVATYHLNDSISEKGLKVIEAASKLGTLTYTYAFNGVEIPSDAVDVAKYGDLGEYTITVKLGETVVYTSTVTLKDSSVSGATVTDATYTEYEPLMVDAAGLTEYDFKANISSDNLAVINTYAKYNPKYVLIDAAGNETVIVDGKISAFTASNRRFYKVAVRPQDSDFDIYVTYVDFYATEDGTVWLPTGAEYASFVKGMLSTGWATQTITYHEAIYDAESGTYSVTFPDTLGGADNSKMIKVIPLHSKAYYASRSSEESKGTMSYSFKYNLVAVEGNEYTNSTTTATFRQFLDGRPHFGLPMGNTYTLGISDRYNGADTQMTVYGLVQNWDEYLKATPCVSDKTSGEPQRNGMLIRSYAQGAGIMTITVGAFTMA